MVTNVSYPQVIAHRGASRAERENTIAAFRRAHEMGAHAVELDVRRTLDNQLIVHHDPALADGRIIVQTSEADLPDHIPTLAEALDACGGMWVNIEIKNDQNEPDFDVDDNIAREVMAHLRHRGELNRWLISSFRRQTIDACHEALPEVRTAWLCVTVADDEIASCATDLVKSGHTALHPWVRTLTPHVIDVCHQHGLTVNTWTVDDLERMQELIAWGIDGLCTNVPDIALGLQK
jgi:glycerophosphoryl diester phosphodiesterase